MSKPMKFEQLWESYLNDNEIKEDNTAWSGAPEQHPYSEDFSKNANQVFQDLNGAYVTLQAMITSSPGHPKNAKLKQIEQALKKAMDDLSSVSTDVRKAPTPGSRPPGVPG
jgi:hypothetical protein